MQQSDDTKRNRVAGYLARATQLRSIAKNVQDPAARGIILATAAAYRALAHAVMNSINLSGAES